MWLPLGERTTSPLEYLAFLWLVKSFKYVEAVTDVPIDWEIYLLIPQSLTGQQALQDTVLHSLKAETNTNKI